MEPLTEAPHVLGGGVMKGTQELHAQKLERFKAILEVAVEETRNGI